MLKSFVKIQKSLSLLVTRHAPKNFNEDHQVETATLLPIDVVEGHFTVIATKGEVIKRFVVKLEYLTDPVFLRLLDKAQEEYGFRQKGALSVPCRPHELQKILDDGKVTKMEGTTAWGGAN